MKKVFSIIFIILFNGCSSIYKTDKKIPISHDENNDYYSSVENYTFFGRDHYINFVNKYGEKVKFSKNEYQMNLESMKRNYKPREINRQKVADWINESHKSFFKDISYVVESGPFHFQIFDRGFEKTLFYVHDNVSSSAYVWDFANNLREILHGVNLVFVDQISVNRNLKTFTSSEIENFFQLGASQVLKGLGEKYLNHKAYFNVICHAQIYTHKFLSETKEVAATIYYAPMVVKNSSDKIVDFEKVFKGETLTDFQNILYLFNLGEYGYASNLMVPKNHSQYNVQTEINLLVEFNKGFDLSSIKNKFLIYPEVEGLLNLESYGYKYFDKSNVIKLDGFKHVDFYSHSSKKVEYIKVIQNLINKN